MEYKKTDAPQPDVKDEEGKEEEKNKGDEEEEEEKLEEKQKSDAEEDGGTGSQDEEDSKPKAEEDEILNRSPRNRKPRREWNNLKNLICDFLSLPFPCKYGPRRGPGVP